MNRLTNSDKVRGVLKAPSQNLIWNLLRNPVEPHLALHQSLPDLLRNLLRNRIEPDLALHQSLPGLLRNLPESCWTWPGSAPKPPRPSAEPAPEPSPEPCWTSPGSAPKPPRPSPEPLEPSPEPRWTWPAAPAPVHPGAILGWRPH